MLKLEYIGPKGKIVLKTLAMPNNTNVNGDIFGGWIMSQMDIGGAILAKEITGRRVVTVKSIITFLKPISIGDLVSCYAKLISIGNTSITIKVEIWTKKISSKPIGIIHRTTKSIFIFVAVDNKGKSTKIFT